MPPFALFDGDSGLGALVLHFIGEIADEVFVRVHFRNVIDFEKGRGGGMIVGQVLLAAVVVSMAMARR